MTLPAPILEHVADLRVEVATPIEAGSITGLNSRGRRRIIPITGGRLTGPHFSGRVLPGGADFQLVVSETSADLDARYIVELDSPGLEGQHLYIQNHALRRGSVADMARLVRGERVDPQAIYFRSVLTLEVSCEPLQWLTEHVLVGTGARHPDHVQISIFRLL